MKSRIIYILFCLILLLSGCSKTDEKKEDSSSLAYKESMKDKITIMHVDYNKEGFKRFIKETEDILNINIEVIAPPANADNRHAKISTMLSAGDTTADIFSVNDEMISEFKHLGYLESLGSDVMTEDIRRHYSSDYIEKIAMIDGDIYSVPYLLDIMVFWVNEKHLEQAGISSIETLEDFKKLASTEFEDGCYGYGSSWEVTYAYNEIFQLINMFGGDYDDWENEYTKMTLEFLYDMNASEKVSKEQLIDQYDQMIQKFIDGKYGAIFMYSGAFDLFYNSGNYGDDGIHVAPLPLFREKVTNIATWQYVLTKASKRTETAKKFLRYAASKEGSEHYARCLNSLPARMDVIIEENFSLVGGEDLKTYFTGDIQYRARPLTSNAMKDITKMGNLFQNYMTDQISYDEMAKEMMIQIRGED